MTSTESLRLVHRLIRADFDLCHAMRTTTGLEAAAAEERMAAACVLEGLLGRVPTEMSWMRCWGLEGQMSKHSRAPFTIDDRYEEPNVVGADGFIVAELPGIATSPSWFVSNQDKHWASDPASHIHRPIEELEANASLFAAAPELLAVVKLVRAAMPWHVFGRAGQPGMVPDDCEFEGTLKVTAGDLRDIDDAIAKAEGK